MSTPKRILVVDDDPVIGKSFHRVLSGKGYAVITAADGEEALRKLHSETYDLVFTDIRMPGMSGLEVAERVRASQPWLPVVIVTAHGSDDHEARATAAGVAGFLRKPVTPDMIETSTAMALATAGVARVEAAPAPPAIGARVGSRTRNVALFLAAPFIGLAYLLAFPIVGLGMLAWMAGKAVMKNDTLRPIALLIAAPFITLAFVIIGPIVGLAALVWIGGKALMKR